MIIDKLACILVGCGVWIIADGIASLYTYLKVRPDK